MPDTCTQHIWASLFKVVLYHSALNTAMWLKYAHPCLLLLVSVWEPAAEAAHCRPTNRPLTAGRQTDRSLPANKQTAHCRPTTRTSSRDCPLPANNQNQQQRPPTAGQQTRSYTHRCRKQIWSVEAMLCHAKCCKKKVENNFSARSAVANFLKVYTFRLQKKAFFSTVYNILASLSDLSNPQVQYSIHVENRYCTEFVVVPRRPPPGYIAFAACSSLFENLH